MKNVFTRFLSEPSDSFRRLFECFTCWGPPLPQGDVRGAQIVLTQAASNLKGSRASQTNKDLAWLAYQYADQLRIPVFPQAEVGDLLNEMGIPTVGTTSYDTDARLFSRAYMGSGVVAELQKEYCDKYKLQRAIVVAPYPHFWRVLWIYERLGFVVIIPPDIPKLHFERDYVQWRWRRAVTAYPYELLARLYFFYKGII